MLAASSGEQDRALELFDLTLPLGPEKRADTSSGLSQHFNAILRQARALAEDPGTVKSPDFPGSDPTRPALREGD